MSFGWSCKSLKTLSMKGRVKPEMTIWELSGFSLALPYVLSVIRGVIKSAEAQDMIEGWGCFFLLFLFFTAEAQI